MQTVYWRHAPIYFVTGLQILCLFIYILSTRLLTYTYTCETIKGQWPCASPLKGSSSLSLKHAAPFTPILRQPLICLSDQYAFCSFIEMKSYCTSCAAFFFLTPAQLFVACIINSSSLFVNHWLVFHSMKTSQFIHLPI